MSGNNQDAQAMALVKTQLASQGNEISTLLLEMRNIRKVTDVPCAIGFGISTPEQAKKMAAVSDGAIVGSAIVKIIAKYGKDAAPYLAEYVRSMKEAVAEA